jgi:hypothetical protein
MQLRLDYDPGVMTFSAYANANPALAGIMVNDVAVSSSLHKVMIIWVDLTPVSLTDGSDLLDLNFTYVAGSGTLSFNNSSNGGGDCEYAGINAIAMNDMPTSTYYHDATITFGGVGTPGTIFGPASVCKGSTGVAYTVAPVNGASSYTWGYSGTGATIAGTTNAVTINYSSSATSGNLTVAGVNAACGTGSYSPAFPVTINPLPVPVITGTNISCIGSTVVYTTQPGMNTYLWTVSAGGTMVAGGTPNDNTMTVTWYIAGAQTVCVNYTNASGCSASSPTCYTVTVNAVPVPSISGPSSTPVGTTGNVYTTQPGMTNYVWTITSGGTITAGGSLNDNTVIVSWNVAGGQSVCVGYTNPVTQCSSGNPTCYTVTVGNVPTPPGPVSGPASVCQGDQNLVYSVSPISNATSYAWSVPSGISILSGSTTNSITVSAGLTAVSGNISVYGINSYGNGAISSLSVTVSSAPAGAGVVSGPSGVCTGETGVGYSLPVIASATNYTWTIPSGVSIVAGNNTNMITVNFGSGAVSGGFSVAGSNSCGNGPSSSILYVTINPIPETPVITSPGFYTATSSASTGNQWFEEGPGLIPGATAQVLNVTHDGKYYTQVTLNGCVSDTSNHLWVLVEGIRDLNEAGLELYPVPDNGQFRIIMHQPPAGLCSVFVINTLGEVIFQKNNVNFSANSEMKIDLRPVPTGIYSVIIENHENSVVRKILIVN